MTPRPMTPGERMLDRIASLEQSVQDLQRGQRIGNTSQRGGTYVVVDELGAARVRLGDLGSDHYGIEILDGDGRTLFRVDETGQGVPLTEIAWSASAEPVISSNPGAWTTVYDALFGEITHDAVRINAAVGAETGTTVDARIYLEGLAVATAAQSVVGDDGTTALQWNWLPGWEDYIGDVGVTSLSLQIIRTAGSGDIYAGYPHPSYMANRDAIGATATGV